MLPRKGGTQVQVLERRESVGGGAISEEFHPGFSVSTLEHSTGPFSPQIAADLNLASFGLELITPDVRVLSFTPEGKTLCVHKDTAQTASEIEKFSAKDAKSYPEFVTSFSRIGSVLTPLLSMTPPSIDEPNANDSWNLGKVGLSFRGLGKKDEYRLLRWGPMAVADLVAEWFDTELLRAMVAARGISGGVSLVHGRREPVLGLLWQSALDGTPFSPTTFVKGGLGSLTQASAKAASSAGANIRTGVDVGRIETTADENIRVILKSGEEIQTRLVVSNAIAKTTLLDLVDLSRSYSNFLSKVRNYRSPGIVGKVNLALDGLPSFRGLNNSESSKLSGRVHIGPEIDYLERAFDASKYKDFSPLPFLDITIPSLADSTLAPSGKHVMSIQAQFAPYKLKEGDWNSRREEFADRVVDVVSEYAPQFRDLILARQVITPLDLEQTYGLHRGHIHHGEQTLDQFFTFRPLISWAQYRTPVKRLYLCGAGTHPGGGVTGLPGANAAREVLKDLKAKRI